ncbi:MAG: hypothetical protein LBK67_02050, partial [Coriobacteriales bacterium]|nr:hypothetical protein [Coriobacteriales bacterium]
MHRRTGWRTGHIQRSPRDPKRSSRGRIIALILALLMVVNGFSPVIFAGMPNAAIAGQKTVLGTQSPGQQPPGTSGDTAGQPAASGDPAADGSSDIELDAGGESADATDDQDDTSLDLPPITVEPRALEALQPFSLSPMAVIDIDLATVTGSGPGYSFAGGTLSFGADAAKNSYRLWQSGTALNTTAISVESGVKTSITLDNVQVTSYTRNVPAFYIALGAAVNLTLVGDNLLAHTV